MLCHGRLQGGASGRYPHPRQWRAVRPVVGLPPLRRLLPLASSPLPIPPTSLNSSPLRSKTQGLTGRRLPDAAIDWIDGARGEREVQFSFTQACRGRLRQPRLNDGV